MLSIMQIKAGFVKYLSSASIQQLSWRFRFFSPLTTSLPAFPPFSPPSLLRAAGQGSFRTSGAAKNADSSSDAQRIVDRTDGSIALTGKRLEVLPVRFVV